MKGMRVKGRKLTCAAALFLAVMGCSMTETSGAQQGVEHKLTMSLAEIEHIAPHVYRAIETLNALAPTADEGVIDSPFVVKGRYVNISEVEKSISQDQELCKSIFGKKIFYDTDSSGKNIYRVSSNLVENSRSIICNCSLDKDNFEEEKSHITKISPDKKLESLFIEIMTENSSPIVLVNIITSATGKLIYARFYEEVGFSVNLMSQILPMDTPRGPRGRPTILTYVYNFVLERGVNLG